MEYPYYAFSQIFGSFVAEAEYAKELGKYLFYDEDKDAFLDKDGNLVDITGYDIFPRTGIVDAEKLVEALYRHGGFSTFVKIGDYEKTLNWPNYVSTKRHNVIMTGQEILDNGKKIIEEFGSDKVFFKTKRKNYSQVLPVERLLEREGAFYNTLKEHKDDDFIISDVVNIVEDEFGNLEYRAYVTNGGLNNVSRVHDYLVGYVSPEVSEFIEGIIKELKSTDFPTSFVIDVFECKDENGQSYLDVLECNPIVASGTYLYNSIFGRRGYLNHVPFRGDFDPFDTIPYEKLKYGPKELYSKTSHHKGRPSICYNLSGGFAGDLMSFNLFGRASNGMYIHIDYNRDIDPTNIGLGNQIDSDDDIIDSDDNIIDDVKQLLKKPNEVATDTSDLQDE